MAAPLSPAGPAERSEWSAEGTTVAAVSRALRDLLAEHLHHAHGHASTWTLNLVVTPAPPARVRRGLDSLHAHAPARTVILREHAESRIDAQVVVECAGGEHPNPGYCHEEVTLRVGHAQLARAPSLVRPLMLHDLPTVVWAAGADPRVAGLLAPIADHVLLDTAGGGEPMAEIRQADELARRANVVDLQWLRLAVWRGRVAAVAGTPRGREVVRAADHLEVRFGPGAETAALLLTGWVVARLGWRDLSLPGGPSGRRGGALRPGGATVAVHLARDDEAPDDAVTRVTVGRGADRLIVADRGGPGGGGSLADALSRIDDPAPGYAAALAALAER